jgi:ethanolamine utilization protein EutQ (cupin superfamily)
MRKLVEYSEDMPEHWCERRHIGYALEGRMEVRFGDGVPVYTPGDGVFIPDGG